MSKTDLRGARALCFTVRFAKGMTETLSSDAEFSPEEWEEFHPEETVEAEASVPEDAGAKA